MREPRPACQAHAQRLSVLCPNDQGAGDPWVPLVATLAVAAGFADNGGSMGLPSVWCPSTKPLVAQLVTVWMAEAAGKGTSLVDYKQSCIHDARRRNGRWLEGSGAVPTMLVVSVKIIRNKITGHPKVYGFVEFVSHAAAERILQTTMGHKCLGTEQCFRMNWPLGMVKGVQMQDLNIPFLLGICHLMLQLLVARDLQSPISICKGAKVVTDPNTGRSKGYDLLNLLMRQKEIVH
ncbi:polyadenylate-binding protein RBP45-like [Nymphaea colorata]|nr:polyadenylate-binding protein RBP45-like [Nymphaea colorata]